MHYQPPSFKSEYIFNMNIKELIYVYLLMDKCVYWHISLSVIYVCARVICLSYSNLCVYVRKFVLLFFL